MSPAIIKVCGINDEAALDAAVGAGADMVGFVFFERSPRHLSLERAKALASCARSRTRLVALTVDADDAALHAIVATARPDLLQLHGEETPGRVAEVKLRFGLPVIRALSIAAPADLERVSTFDQVADYLLFDARAPTTASRPGGNGTTFNWSLLLGISPRAPWLLAGGLDAGNVATALASTGANGVDVSSGVECSTGVKDCRLIAAFVSAARGTPREPSSATDTAPAIP